MITDYGKVNIFFSFLIIIFMLCSCTVCASVTDVDKKYSMALVNEAELRDLASQADRAIFYARMSKFKIQKEQEQSIRLKSILEELRSLLMIQGETADRTKVNYNEIEKKLKEGGKIATDILQAITGQMRQKYPWTTYSKPENISVWNKEPVFKRDRLKWFFYGTNIPKESLNKLDMVEPFKFNFLSYSYKPKAVNKREGEYDWKILDNGLKRFADHACPMDISVDFGTMKAWPLMKEFSWIPGKYSEAEIKEMLFQNDRDEVLWRSGFHSVLNIWHPVILEYERNWIRALGRYCQNQNVAIYELFNEIGLSTNKRPAGYGKYAQISFHRYLEKKYGNIEKLNERLNTSFNKFEAIKLPTGDSYVKSNVPIGLIYEFERFRKESLVSYIKDMIAELRKADSNQGHAISSQFTGWLNDSQYPKMSARDFLMLASLDWDLYGVHNAGDGKFPAISLLYHYCINRYAKKIYWNDEFWWDYREAEDQKVTDERILRAVAERNMWRHLAYGVKGFNIFPGLYSSEPGGLLTKGKLMRYATGVFPIVMKKINRYANIFFDAHLLNQKIGILQPSTTLDIASGEFLANENAMKLSDWMLSEHIIPFYIPEECIIDGRENINEFRVLISPYAPFVPGELSEKIRKWVENGGLFISVGPFGKFDQYGKKQETFSKAFPANGGHESVVSQKYGKGKLMFLEKGITYSNYTNYIKPELESFRIVISDVKPEILAIPARKEKYTGERIFYANNDLDLIPWEDKKGGKYLFVINLNPLRRLEPRIKIKGEFKEVLDLAIEGGLPVPAMTKAGFTEFETILEPGQGIMYRLL